MLADGVDAASAAFEVDYESASQFNREYSRLFGHPPMRDIRILRTPRGPSTGVDGQQCLYSDTRRTCAFAETFLTMIHNPLRDRTGVHA